MLMGKVPMVTLAPRWAPKGRKIVRHRVSRKGDANSLRAVGEAGDENAA